MVELMLAAGEDKSPCLDGDIELKNVVESC